MTIFLFHDKLHIFLLEFGLLICPLNGKCVALRCLYFDITNVIFKCICIVPVELCIYLLEERIILLQHFQCHYILGVCAN